VSEWVQTGRIHISPAGSASGATRLTWRGSSSQLVPSPTTSATRISAFFCFSPLKRRNGHQHVGHCRVSSVHSFRHSSHVAHWILQSYRSGTDRSCLVLSRLIGLQSLLRYFWPSFTSSQPATVRSGKSLSECRDPFFKKKKKKRQSTGARVDLNMVIDWLVVGFDAS
jgi:hypothetical protein